MYWTNESLTLKKGNHASTQGSHELKEVIYSDHQTVNYWLIKINYLISIEPDKLTVILSYCFWFTFRR